MFINQLDSEKLWVLRMWKLRRLVLVILPNIILVSVVEKQSVWILGE